MTEYLVTKDGRVLGKLGPPMCSDCHRIVPDHASDCSYHPDNRDKFRIPKIDSSTVSN